MDNRVQTGLVVCASIEDYVSEKIKKHEFTRHEKEIDRICHSDACDANTSPIFLTYRQNSQVNHLINTWKIKQQPIYDFTSFHDVTHKVWLIDNSEVIQELTQVFGQDVDYLYIADGHHRTESAVKVGQKRQTEFPFAPKEAEFNKFLAVLFPKEELAIWDYNRILNVNIPENFLQNLEKIFVINLLNTHTPVKPPKAKSFSMYYQKQWYLLTLPDHCPLTNDPVKDLDVSILQDWVFDPLFNITDVRTDKRIDFIGGIRGLSPLAKLVDSGEYTIAFALFPTTMDDLLHVADAGKIMPPKSTWFEPKLLSGLFIHEFDTDSYRS